MNGLYDEIRIALFSIWNRRWLALAVAWAFCVLGWLVVAMIPNGYESEARVQVRTQSFLPDKVGISSNDRRKTVQQLEQTLTSSTNLEQVIRGTDLGQTVVSEKEMSGAIAGLRKQIDVESDQDDFFTITASLPSGRLARDVVQKLIDVAEEDNIAGDRKETSQTLRFLEKQIEARKAELDEADAKKVEYERNNLGLLPGVGSVSQRIEAARAELNQIESQLVQAQSALAALNGQLAGTPQTLSTPIPGAPGGGASPAAVALSQARGQLASLRSRGLTDRHPDVISAQKQVAALTAQARSAPARSSGRSSFTTPNPAYSQLNSLRAREQASVAALQSRKGAIQGDLAKLSAQQTAEPGVAAEYNRINRDYEVLKDQYDELISNRETIRMKGQVETQTDAIQFKVINQPQVSNVPAAPNRPLLLTLVLFAGIGAGVGIAFALGHLQTSFPTAAKLEKASGLPVIGSISQMLNKEQREERKRKMKLFYGGTAALVGVFALLLVAEFVQRGLTA